MAKIVLKSIEKNMVMFLSCAVSTLFLRMVILSRCLALQDAAKRRRCG